MSWPKKYLRLGGLSPLSECHADTNFLRSHSPHHLEMLVNSLNIGARIRGYSTIQLTFFMFVTAQGQFLRPILLIQSPFESHVFSGNRLFVQTSLFSSAKNNFRGRVPLSSRLVVGLLIAALKLSLSSF